MPHLTAIEYSEAQRRQIKDEIERLNKSGRPLSAKYDAESFETWEKLFENAVSPGLFVQREAIVIENAEILGNFPENLSPLLEDDNADIVIIIALNGDGKFLKAVSKQITFIKPDAQIPPWKRKDWLISLAKEQGFTLSSNAALLLAENIESQEELRGEIAKLSIYADGGNITLDDAENLSFDEGGRALMTLLDGVCEGKAENVARALNHLREGALLPVLTALSNRLRPAMMISLFGEFNDEALRAIDADPARKKYAVTKAKSALKNYGASRIIAFMMKAARLSFLEKTLRAEGWFGFEALIWELMTKEDF